MPLTTASAPGLVAGGTATPRTAMKPTRWVKLLRTVVGCQAAAGEVVELDAKFAAELITSNKAVRAEPPKPPAVDVAADAPAAPAAPAAPTPPPARRGTRPVSSSKES